MITGKKHNVISNPEGVKYHGNNENYVTPSGLENNGIPVCYNNNIPSGLKRPNKREDVHQFAMNLPLKTEIAVNKTISHDRSEETPEAKAYWFQSLPLSERMDMLCYFTDLILNCNPKIMDQKKMLNRLRDVFASFQKHQVKYVVIGGVAAVLHGVPRATFDLDILIAAT